MPRRHRARVTLVTVTLVAVASLSACTPDQPDPGPSQPTATASPATEPSVDPSPSTTPDAAHTAVVTLPRDRGTVDVAVRSLTLDDNDLTMTLRVDFTPHLAEPDEGMTLSAINAYRFIFPELLDREHLKRYSVITGEGTQDWLTNKDATTDDGDTLSSWFVYAAPEDDVDSFTLTMDGWALEIPGVEVDA